MNFCLQTQRKNPRLKKGYVYENRRKFVKQCFCCNKKGLSVLVKVCLKNIWMHFRHRHTAAEPSHPFTQPWGICLLVCVLIMHGWCDPHRESYGTVEGLMSVIFICFGRRISGIVNIPL